ncbi:MAG: hypothetical protein FJY74_09365 [Candidatus Eisenbacteria bacterium]|nr:hypothetical protein [Candidatus Eisenbacteria bacterium]
MPIEYSVSEGGHFIHAIASGEVTDDEFVDYEERHSADARVRAPCNELLDVHRGAFARVTPGAVERVFERRKQSKKERVCHHCAIVVSYSDSAAWDLAKLYERLASLHSPYSVVVFGDLGIARTWLGVGGV